eukprot:TRINITY_DN11914_c0_g1_i3.p1 TRINITY_DN11914_c0_g1~~TRINITY_DN11914_c0_g1_i3.p1  ORF type:complete len:115 (-),score=8.89 TRINITY_DN11914_c0_g1_i3:203-547(-)
MLLPETLADTENQLQCFIAVTSELCIAHKFAYQVQFNDPQQQQQQCRAVTQGIQIRMLNTDSKANLFNNIKWEERSSSLRELAIRKCSSGQDFTQQTVKIEGSQHHPRRVLSIS